ncbi:hypothetical protein TNCV_1092831 [Trichonephila clavipes]|nr:hypothetical protein TNCV_1092831 [Trichonephila clavipes]
MGAYMSELVRICVFQSGTYRNLLKWVCLRRWSSGSRGVLRARDASGRKEMASIDDSGYFSVIQCFSNCGARPPGRAR